MSVTNHSTAPDCVAADLAGRIERFPRTVRLMRLALFRLWLDLHVRSCTPLLGVVGALDGIDFAAAAWRMLPPGGWPEESLIDDGARAGRAGARPFRFTPSQIIRRHRSAGVIACSEPARDYVVGMRVVGRGLELTAVDAGLRLDTRDGVGRLLVDIRLPETISVAAIGRDVGALLSHRWLGHRGWLVTSVTELPDNRTEILFETGRDAWRMPWGLVGGSFAATRLQGDGR